MPDPSDFGEVLDRLIQQPKENRIGLEFRIPQNYLDGGVELYDYETLIGEIRTCGQICRDVALYIGWLERRDPHPLSEAAPSQSEHPSPDDLFAEFHRWLTGLRGNFRTQPIEDYVWPHVIAERLLRLHNISIYPIPVEYDVALSFLGAYSENPSVTRILANGGAISAVVLSLVFGTVQVMKEASASVCRAQYAELVQKQTEVFERSARLQGKWTPELRASHEEAIKAFAAASSRCGSILDHVDLKIDYAPERSATMHFGGASSAGGAPPSPRAATGQ
jgi:hypothetical protein